MRSQSLKVPVVEPYSILFATQGNRVRDCIDNARGNGNRSIAEILMHDRLTAAQTRRVLDQLDQAYIQISPAEYAKQRKEMGLVRKRPVSVAELQLQLRPRESLVEYVLEEKGSYAIEISRTGLKIHNLPPRSQISGLARSFVTAIRSGTEPNPAEKNCTSNS